MLHCNFLKKKPSLRKLIFEFPVEKVEDIHLTDIKRNKCVQNY
jgi:hypothetical protein